jgi:hypothetical protein
VIELRVAEPTISGAAPLTVPNVADMVVEPAATPVATPTLPDELLMVAAAGVVLAHVTSCVMFWSLASLKVPIAVNACTVSGSIVVVEGPTTMDAIVAFVTTSAAVPFTESNAAVMVVDPGATETARPVVAPTVAAAEFEDDHAACVVMLRLLPSL